MEKNLKDIRIIEFMKKRGISGDTLTAFLNPDIKDLRDPYKLRGMKEAAERIKRAVADNESIVVYGDYDCDGVCASSIMHQYLTSLGAKVDVYIPSRFDDGYGLTRDMINEIMEKSKPSLIITVDLGVSAKKEVELLKSLGVDVVITDHHEPTSEIPDCITVDPKFKGQDYGFEGLCGAGVALKVVEAIGGTSAAKEYLDICSLATVGDIVPLLDENRAIVTKGLEIINSGKARASISFLLKKLGFKSVNASDLSFRVVPKLNASGRMDQGIKVFKFLIEKDEKKLEELYSQIEQDNEKRLACIEEANEEILKQIHKLDLRKHKIIILRGKFHEGILGILASKVMHEFNRPCIVFTEGANNTYKGSGRSLDGIDILKALEPSKNILVRFGGHTQAAGVEVTKANFKEFLKRINEAFEHIDDNAYLKKFNYDIEITEKDISASFISEVDKLEPFGCANEKPIFMLKENAVSAEQLSGKNSKHLRLTIGKDKKIIAFNMGRLENFFESPISKNIIVDLEMNEFRGKSYAQGILREVYISNPEKFLFKNEYNVMNSLINKFQSLKSEEKCRKELKPLKELMKKYSEKSAFGTIIVIDSQRALDQVGDNLYGFTFSHEPLSSRQNTILLSPSGVISSNELNGYKNVIFTRVFIEGEHDHFAKQYNAIEQIGTVRDLKVNINKDRAIFGSVYKTIQRYSKNIYANSLFDFFEKLKKCEQCLGLEQICFSCLVFYDLGLIGGNLLLGELNYQSKTQKLELSSSKMYNLL